MANNKDKEKKKKSVFKEIKDSKLVDFINTYI